MFLTFIWGRDEALCFGHKLTSSPGINPIFLIVGWVDGRQLELRVVVHHVRIKL